MNVLLLGRVSNDQIWLVTQGTWIRHILSADTIDQQGDTFDSHLFPRLMESCKSGPNNLGKWNVIETNDGDISGNLKSAVLYCLDCANGNQVVAADNGIRPRLTLQQCRGLPNATLHCEILKARVLHPQFLTILLKGILKTLESFAGSKQMFSARKKGQPFPAGLEKIINRLGSSQSILRDQLIGRQTPKGTTTDQNGDIAGEKGSDRFIARFVRLAFAANQNESFHPISLKNLERRGLLLRIAVAVREHNPISEFQSNIMREAAKQRVLRVRNVGNDKPKKSTLTGTQIGRLLISRIAQLLGRFQNADAIRCTTSFAGQDSRCRFRRNSGQFGDLVDVAHDCAKGILYDLKQRGRKSRVNSPISTPTRPCMNSHIEFRTMLCHRHAGNAHGEAALQFKTMAVIGAVGA